MNTHNAFDAAAGFGGYKESGFGREGGIEGLYEYVKPSWYPAIRNSFSKEELERPFGDTIPATPLPSASPSAFALQGVNRTYKAYIGGKQARPDGQYSRSVMSKTDGSLLGEVADCNRKDVRNAGLFSFIFLFSANLTHFFFISSSKKNTQWKQRQQQHQDGEQEQRTIEHRSFIMLLKILVFVQMSSLY